MNSVNWQFLPYLEYESWLKKKELVKKDHLLNGNNYLIFTEHNDIITVGKNGNINNILNVAHCKNIPVYEIDRGGDVTCHGKGQLMFYPVFPKNFITDSVRKLVLFFEETVIELLAEYKIVAYVRKEFPGVWTDKGKIAAIGLNLSNGVITHGMSLYVDINREIFKCIVPCGLSDKRVDSISNYIPSVTVEESVNLWLNVLKEKLKSIEFKESRFLWEL